MKYNRQSELLANITLMRKEKLVYNTQTLRYEKVIETTREMALRIFGTVSALVITAFIFTLIIHRFFPSSSEKDLRAENDALILEIKKMTKDVDAMSLLMDDAKEQTYYAHRSIYGMDPIDDGIWKGGTGGHDKYQNLRNYKNSGEALVDINIKIDQVKQKMDVYSQSLTEVINLTKENEDMLASIPSIKPVRSDKLPRSVKLLSGFGYRIHPIYKVRKLHTGIDFTAPRGTPIIATGDGVIEKAGRGSGYGNRVVINHGYGYQTQYAHMFKIEVKVGQKVKRGDQIGLVGSTGASTAPHCHYEVMHKGKKVNPIQYVLDGLSPKEYQNLVDKAATHNESMD